MTLADYLERINFSGPVRADLATLNALHAAHLQAIPFENIDVLLQRPSTQDVEAIFDKLVTRRRGGWCYEMNGLFGWVLAQIGFDVRRISAGVRRAVAGDEMLGNHLCLMVRLDQDYLVDVGFGGGQYSAIPMMPGVTNQPPKQMALVDLGDGYWRMHEGGPRAAHCYDFAPDQCDENLLAERFDFQCNNPASIFRQNLSVNRRSGRNMLRIRSRLYEVFKPGHKNTRVLASADELLDVLASDFGLNEPELARMWPMICDRHAAIFPEG